MAGKVLEIKNLINPHTLATNIADKYVNWESQRAPYIAEAIERRDFIFATDTRSTTVGKNTNWKNSTTTPKLCQIRDNLHANYMSAWFPNDDWFKWLGASREDDVQSKANAIEGWMSNKLRESGFYTTIAEIAYDYIDNGNAFGEVIFVKEYKTDPESGEEIPGYIGPKLVRKSMLDQVFNPAALSYEQSPKITRYVKTLGELKMELETRPDLGYNEDVINYLENVRNALGGYQTSDINKAMGYAVDGFGSLSEYYQSGYVEILEFEGHIHDEEGKFLKNQMITVVDRTQVLRHETNPTWFTHDNKLHCPWRHRPDNLYGMGPLDNLVGMQYRIDHLENIKADAMDLAIHPPLKIRGNVDEFEWGPNEEIYVGDDGDVEEMGKNLQFVMVTDSEIAMLENKMEELAGSPRTSMGIRTPGEKTAFEVQTLDNAANRIFQHKVQNFEQHFIERALNLYLEIGRHYFEGEDLIRIMDDDFGVSEFLNITKEDITAKGKLRPVGARHFATRNNLVQNLTTLYQSNIGQVVQNHVSTKKLAKLLEETLGLEKFELVRENVGIMEQLETQQLINSGSQQLQEEQITPLEPEEEDAVQQEL